MPLSYDLITFQILGQKSVNFFWGFLENLKFQKDILKLSDLYVSNFVTKVLSKYVVTPHPPSLPTKGQFISECPFEI